VQQWYYKANACRGRGGQLRFLYHFNQPSQQLSTDEDQDEWGFRISTGASNTAAPTLTITSSGENEGGFLIADPYYVFAKGALRG
jgi:hypothetical protein